MLEELISTNLSIDLIIEFMNRVGVRSSSKNPFRRRADRRNEMGCAKVVPTTRRRAPPEPPQRPISRGTLSTDDILPCQLLPPSINLSAECFAYANCEFNGEYHSAKRCRPTDRPVGRSARSFVRSFVFYRRLPWGVFRASCGRSLLYGVPSASSLSLG